MNNWFEVQEVGERAWAIREPFHEEQVISYLLEGDAEALLLDTGMGLADIRKVVTSLTRRHIVVVNTHSHYDHVGGNGLFDNIAIHTQEADQLEKGVGPGLLTEVFRPSTFRRPPPGTFNPSGYGIPPSHPSRLLVDKDTLDLGGRSLEVIHTPGHSPGSICLWERPRGLLFTGDTIYKGPIYAQLPQSDFGAYRHSLERLSSLVPQARSLFPAHGDTPIEPSFILDLAEGFRRVAEGMVPSAYEDSPWGKTRVYSLGGYSILLK